MPQQKKQSQPTILSAHSQRQSAPHPSPRNHPDANSSRAAALAIFFAIPIGQVNQELAQAAANFDDLLDEILIDEAMPIHLQTPATEARSLHHYMLRSSILHREYDLPRDEWFYVITMPAVRIAHAATAVALTRGRLAQIEHEIDEIYKRETRNNGRIRWNQRATEEYASLRRESTHLSNQVRATILLHLLRRYQLCDLADDYENNPEDFMARMEGSHKAIAKKARSHRNEPA